MLCINAFNKLVNDALNVEVFFNSTRPGTFFTLKTKTGLTDYYVGQNEFGEKTVEIL